MKPIGVGLLGFGTVGAGVVEGLRRNRERIAARIGTDVVLRRIADLDIDSDRGVKVDRGILTRNAQEVIDDPDVQIVVELIGGSGVARDLVLAALSAGKPVVTANKKLLAEHGDEIFGMAECQGLNLGFGASVGGGIPIIRVMREGLAGDVVQRIHGILNGTCNYILTRMENEGLDFDQVLSAAQKAGYAEADPSLDIDGHDTAHKATILASLAYGFHVPLDAVPVEGIRGLNGMDVRFARELGYRIKLLAMVAREGSEIEVCVHPTLVRLDHMLASVSGVFNAVMVRGELSGDTLYYGRGAGREPTAGTVIADIADIAHTLRARPSRLRRAVAPMSGETRRMRPLAEIRRAYYLRLMVRDQAGSLGCFTNILGKHGVSIAAAMQKQGGAEDGPFVPVVTLTHETQEARLEKALDEIAASGVVEGRPTRLRILA